MRTDVKAAEGSNSVTPPKWEGLDVLELALRVSGVPPGTGYGLVLRDSRVLCALPEDGETASRTLALYQPQRWKAKCLAAGFRMAAGCGVHRSVLRRWRMPGGDSGSTRPVGVLVGSGGHRCDRAVTVAKGFKEWEVTKLAFGPEGMEILGAEAEMLELLADSPRVPRMLSFSTRDNTASLRMAWQEGRPWHSESLAPLLEMLGEWIDASAFRPVGDFPEWCWIRGALERAGVEKAFMDAVAARRVAASIRHGDLTRPNLRMGPGRLLCAHDWERGAKEGMAGLDLVHFLVQDLMFRKRPGPDEVVESVRVRLDHPMVHGWLVSLGWLNAEDELMALNFALNSGAGYMDQSALLASVLRSSSR